MEYSVDHLDLEDIESRLYSQIYHNSELENAETSIISTTNTTFDENFKKKYRYFDIPVQNYIVQEPQSFIPLVNPPNNTDSCRKTVPPNYSVSYPNPNNLSAQTSLTFTPNCTVSYSNQDQERIPNNTEKVIDTCYNIPPQSPQSYSVTHTGQDRELFQNNITFNQYSFPVLINPDLLTVESRSESRSPTIQEKKRKKSGESKKKSNIKRKLRRRKSSRQKVAYRAPVRTEVICLSDSDDCKVVEGEDMSSIKINTKFPKKYNEADGDKLPEVDDDVIFIPPPPIEVINVDSQEQSTDHADLVVEAVTPELINPESNDFLETHIEPVNNDFNFALHGSDFNAVPTESREPHKPAEYCETESSCSTNDHHSRDFSNTVKTIVFDEVDFPKEDIFSENNLESFSTFITPKRSSNKTKEIVDASQTPKKSIENRDHSTDTSSSESDYENNSNKKTSSLPNLSPMVPCDTLNKSEHIKRVKERSVKNKKERTNRRKNRSVENDNFRTPNSPKSKSGKKKWDHSTPLPTSSVVRSPETKEPENSLEEENSKRKKKKRISCSNESTNLPEEHVETTECSDNIEKNRKKKKSFSKTDENSQDLEEEDQPDQTQLKSDKLKKKKKNKESISCDNNPDEKAEPSVDNNEPMETMQEAIDSFIKNIEMFTELAQKMDAPNSKTKKKKNSPVESENSAVEESSDNSKKKKKKNEKENAEEVDNNTLSNQPIEDTVEPCASTSNALDDSIIEVVDLDLTNTTQIIVSSDSDGDIEVLDDTGKDITLNLNSSIDVDKSTSSLPENDYERIVGMARAPLKDYEQFSISSIQSKQSDDPQKWIISFKDKSTYLNNRGNRGPRCNRCRHFGHISIKCPEKPHPPPCILCGEPNHQEPRCPLKLCTQCGHRGDYSTTYCYKCFKFRHTVCRLCQMVGHIETTCPDLWRRYRSTTDKGPMVISAPAKPRFQQWCSSCAKQGHLEHECNYYSRHYPPTTPFICSYEDNLEHDKHIRLQQESVPAPSSTPSASTPSVSYPEVSLSDTPTPLPLFQVSPNWDVPSTSKNDEIIVQMKRNFGNPRSTKSGDMDLDDATQVRKLFMTTPHHTIIGFLKEQFNTLNRNLVDPRILKRKIFRIDRLADTKKDLPVRIVREKNHWYRLLNMFILGTHKHHLGHFHYNYLKRYISEAKDVRLDDRTRNSLFKSYSYIFGCDKHADVDYYKILRLLIRKHYGNDKNVS